MQTVRVRDIVVGQRFEDSLFLSTGQKLLASGTAITERHIQAIRRSGAVTVLMASGVQELAEAGALRSSRSSGNRGMNPGGARSKYKVGSVSREAVVTRAGHVVLEPGDVVEDHHLDAIDAASEVELDESAPQPVVDRKQRIQRAEQLHQRLAAREARVVKRVHPGNAESWMNPGSPADWPSPDRLSEAREDYVITLSALYAKLEAGIRLDLSEFNPIVLDLVDKLRVHPTRFTQLALLCQRRAEYLPDHALTVTVLAMAIAASLDWSLADVRKLAQAGLVFDSGMLLVPKRIRQGDSELTALDRKRVNAHPVMSLALIDQIDGAGAELQLAAVQHQERENGSGYPGMRRGDQISDFARVLAVADVFAAMTGPRSFRRSKMPYVAMEETVRLGAAQVLWGPAVKALLRAAGLFPVGSYVKLSTGEHARVLSCNPDQVDRPVVCPVGSRDQPIGKPIDLAVTDRSAAYIARPIDDPTESTSWVRGEGSG